jgi:hypothetical protein
MFGPDKRLRLFIDDVAMFSAESVYFYDAKALVSPVDLFVTKIATIFRPSQARAAKIYEPDFRFPMLAPGQVKPVEFVRGELVARQGVTPGMQFGPASFPGRRLHHVNLAHLPWFDPE